MVTGHNIGKSIPFMLAKVKKIQLNLGNERADEKMLGVLVKYSLRSKL
jgi:hypothetical protein